MFAFHQFFECGERRLAPYAAIVGTGTVDRDGCKKFVRQPRVGFILAVSTAQDGNSDSVEESMRITKHLVLGGIGVLLVLAPSALHAQKVQFSITNTAPLNNGVWTMRPWIGVHDGNFPTFLVGQPASTGVQHIAEDGVTGDVTNVLPPPNVCKGLPSVYSPSPPSTFEISTTTANPSPHP